MQTILDLQMLESHLAHIALSALLGIDSAYCVVQPVQAPCLHTYGECEGSSASVDMVDDGHDVEQNQRVPDTPEPNLVKIREQVRGSTTKACATKTGIQPRIQGRAKEDGANAGISQHRRP